MVNQNKLLNNALDAVFLDTLLSQAKTAREMRDADRARAEQLLKD